MKLFTRLRTQPRFGGVDGPVSALGPNSGTLTVSTVVQVIPANSNRLGLELVSDPAGSGWVYGLAASGGTPSASNFHFALAPGGSFDGQVSQAVWSGPIRLWCAGSIAVGVWEV